MPKHGRIDQATRERLVRWLLYKMKELNIPTKKALAKKLGVTPSAVTRALQGGAIGLDFFIAMHRNLAESANRLLEGEPDERPG